MTKAEIKGPGGKLEVNSKNPSAQGFLGGIFTLLHHSLPPGENATLIYGPTTQILKPGDKGEITNKDGSTTTYSHQP